MRRPKLTIGQAMMLVLVASLLLELVDAEARVGGGQRYGGGGGGGSRGGGSYGGGGSGDGEAIRLLLFLLFQNPTIGVPLLLVVGFVWFLSQRSQHGRGITIEDRRYGAPDQHAYRPSHTSSWTRLEQADPGFSEPVFHDFAQLVYRRAHAARSEADRAALAPFVAPRAWSELAVAQRSATDVHDVIVAGSSDLVPGPRPDKPTMLVTITGARIERIDGRDEDVIVREAWRFERAPGVRSLPPDDTLRLGCPSCGAAVQTDPLGRCTHCGTAISAGQLQWQAVEVRVQSREPNRPPEVGWLQGGEEPGYRLPTVVDPDLPTQTRAFRGRHPDFDPTGWERRVRDIFLSLQDAWSRNAWDEARPHCTDAAWNTLRFWMVRYDKAGLRNHIDDLSLERVQVVRITVDAWYEAITVRLWATARDWTVEESTGKVVGGNDKTARSFSEYWTYLRAVGSGEQVHDARTCPSCGAPLDKINAAGACGYCDSVVTTGQFDWVLSRIDQPDTFRIRSR